MGDNCNLVHKPGYLRDYMVGKCIYTDLVMRISSGLGHALIRGGRFPTKYKLNTLSLFHNFLHLIL